MKINRFDIGIVVGFFISITLLIILHIFLINKVNDIYKIVKNIEKIEYTTLKKTIPIDSLELYVLKQIMKHEGFRSEPYKDIAGNLTIGYGHKIKQGESFKYISREEGLRLLQEDFNMAISAAIRLSPNLVESQNIYKLYAIAHFIYGKGSGSYANSKLREKVNNCQDVDDEFRKWVYAKVKGKKTKLKHLQDIAEWRIELYNL